MRVSRNGFGRGAKLGGRFRVIGEFEVFLSLN